jgi:hypothetical protein
MPNPTLLPAAISSLGKFSIATTVHFFSLDNFFSVGGVCVKQPPVTQNHYHNQFPPSI